MGSNKKNTFDEIISLYEKCNVPTETNKPINNKINKGTLDNKLNHDFSFINNNRLVHK